MVGEIHCLKLVFLAAPSSTILSERKSARERVEHLVSLTLHLSDILSNVPVSDSSHSDSSNVYECM